MGYWWKDCGRVILASNPILSQRSTTWTKSLRRWTLEARRAELRDEARTQFARARLELDYLTLRLSETPTGRMVRRRIKTAEMNARYVRRAGKQKYIGKKLTNTRKAKRAAAARVRRALQKAKNS